MSGKTVRDAAFHEAGHAVARYLFFGAQFPDLDVKEMSLCADLRQADPPPLEGRDLGRARQLMEAHLIILCCGPLTEVFASPGRDRLERSADYRRALTIAITMSGGDHREAAAYLDWLLIRAKRLIGRVDFEAAASSVGNALLDKRRLSYEDAKALIDEARARLDLQRLADHPLLRMD